MKLLLLICPGEIGVLISVLNNFNFFNLYVILLLGRRSNYRRICNDQEKVILDDVFWGVVYGVW